MRTIGRIIAITMPVVLFVAGAVHENWNSDVHKFRITLGVETPSALRAGRA